MNKMVVVLEWNEEMGRGWMNIDNLKLCLFSKEHTNKDLVSVTEIATEDNSVTRMGYKIEEPLKE